MSKTKSYFWWIIAAIIFVLLIVLVILWASGNLPWVSKQVPIKDPRKDAAEFTVSQNRDTTETGVTEKSLKNKAKTVKIGTWNIENLGPKKRRDPVKFPAIAKVIASYDLLAAQEITDKEGETPQALLDEIQRSAPNMRLMLSPRTGCQPANAKGQEQYAFYYRSDIFQPIGDLQLYDDSDKDEFSREPAVARFRASGGWTFAIATIHTDPDVAPKEIESLASVVDWMKRRYPDEDDFIVLGDFNAGKAYTKTSQLDHMRLRDHAYFTWVVPDSADTTLAAKPQAHDRIVLSVNTGKGEWTGDWGVDQCFTVKEDLSDHWPVWAIFSESEK